MKKLLVLLLFPIISFGALPGPLDTAWWADEAVGGDTVGLLTSLLAHWKMEEAGGNARADSHTGGFNLAELVGEVYQIDEPKIGSYAARPTDGDYLENASDVEFSECTNSFSINFWLKYENAFTNQYIAGCWTEGGTAESIWYVKLNDVSRVTVLLQNADDSFFTCTNTTQLDTMGKYYMITVTSVSDGSCVIYVDGSGESTDVSEVKASTAAHFTIGADTTGTLYNAYIFDIDSVSIWTNRVLSAGEVLQLYNGGNGLDYPF